MPGPWLTVSPLSFDTTHGRVTSSAQCVKKVGSYIELPSFDVDTPWAGSSYVGIQFDYSAQTSFRIPKFVLSLDIWPPSFCLVVRWVKAGVTYRYKLWENVGEKLDVPLYDDTIQIPKNFVLECWSTEQSAAIVLDDTYYIELNTLRLPSPLYNSQENLECAEVLATIFTGPYPQPLPYLMDSTVAWLTN